MIRNIMLVCIITLVVSFCQSYAWASSMDDIYNEISTKYPDEIEILKRYGASENNIKDFIGALESELDKQEVTDSNFDEEVAIAILELYVNGDHVYFFDAVFNGWNLSSKVLMDAMASGGSREVIALLPESFQEIGRLVKEQILGPYIGTVTGNVLLQGSSNFEGAIVSVLGTTITRSVLADGSYCLDDVPAGVQTIVFSKNHYLTKKKIVTIVHEETTSLESVFLKTGDLNNDNKVDLYDIVLLSKTYEKVAGETGYNMTGDINEDGTVNILDLKLVATNYDLVGD